MFGKYLQNRNKVEENNGFVYFNRGEWGGRAEFILIILGYSLGLGNVWRFPYMVYENGGGLFLIINLIMRIFVGIPGFFVELIIGQYSGLGPLHIWILAPIFKGVGIGCLIASFFLCITYNIVLAWALFFILASLQKELPWIGCNHDFNTIKCYDPEEAFDNCERNNLLPDKGQHWWFNRTCFTSLLCKSLNQNETFGCNFTKVSKIRISAPEEFFKRRVLNSSRSISESGFFQGEILFCFILAWLVTWLSVIKGIKTIGKVAYFTAIFPYIILIILFIRNSFLDGALNGIRFYIKTDWSKIFYSKVWTDAAGQAFFSMGVAQGSLITFASYNKFNNNIYRDSLIIIFMDAFSSILSGFVIFFIIGHLALKLKKDMNDVVDAGPGLVFIIYPQAVSYLEPPQLWSTLFFFMIFSVGLGNQMAIVETFITLLTDIKPQFRNSKPFYSAFLCFIFFLCGLPLTLRSGEYWLNLMITYSAAWPMILNATSEILVFCWIYGSRQIMEDLKVMTGIKLWNCWFYLLNYISPFMLITLLVFSFFTMKPLIYHDNTPYEKWSLILGKLVAISSVIVIPVYGIKILISSRYWKIYQSFSHWKRFKALLKPTSDWIPSYKKIEKENLKRKNLQAISIKNNEKKNNLKPRKKYSKEIQESLELGTLNSGK